MSDDFTDRSNVKQVFQCNSLTINYENYGLKSNEKFIVSVERVCGQNMMQLRLADCYDQTKVFQCTVNNGLYEKIRVEQSLHVSFDGFVEHLVKILESCKKGELFMLLAKDNEKTWLQLYEKRSFRNLVHLYLPVSEAPIETVLFHINQSMLALREQVSHHASQAESLKLELISREEKSNALRSEIRILQETLREQENHVFNRNLDEVKQLQNALKTLSEAKDNEEQHFKGIVKTMQEKIEILNNDNYRMNEKLVSADKENEIRVTDVKKLKQQVNYLKEQNEKLQTDHESRHSRDRKYELNMIDLKRQLKDSREKINSLEKHKSDLIAELEAEKIVCQTKRNALQIATEEITKANSIIVKQAREITELQRKSDLRAEVALKQENLLLEKDKEQSKVQQHYRQIEQELKNYCQASNQLSQSIVEIRDFSDNIEDKYKKRIHDIESRLTAICRSEGGTKKIMSGNPLKMHNKFNF